MAQISKYPISKEVYDRILDLLFEITAKLRTKKQVSDFYNRFLTPTENIMLAKRLAIGLLLAKKYKYREISKILKVSMCTIGIVAVDYKYGTAFKEVIDNVVASEEMQDFWLEIAEIASSVGFVGTKGTYSWKYLNTEIKKKRKSKPF